MSEVEKMMQNAGVKKLLYCDICNAQEHALGLCAETECEPFYPPFTAEKQLELIKWLATRRFSLIMSGNRKFQHWYFGNSYNRSDSKRDFDEALALRINDLWQDLTEQERTEIAEILKG